MPLRRLICVAESMGAFRIRSEHQNAVVSKPKVGHFVGKEGAVGAVSAHGHSVVDVALNIDYGVVGLGS